MAAVGVDVVRSSPISDDWVASATARCATFRAVSEVVFGCQVACGWQRFLQLSALLFS